MSQEQTIDVAVLGGGISGLTLAFLLRTKGLSVAAFEKKDRPGGAIETWQKDGFRFELGPNTVLNNAFEIDALCKEVGILEDRLRATPKSKKRFIVKGGQLVPLPGGPLGFLGTSVFSWKAKLRLLKEPFISRAPADREESIAEFVRRRLGQEFLDYAVGPFVSGVYAGDPERLSVRHATGKIFALEARYGSLIRGAIAKRKGPAPAGGLFSFPDGLEALPRLLAERLDTAWRPGSRVTGLERAGGGFTVNLERQGTVETWTAKAVVCALPAREVATLLAPLGEEFAGGMQELPHADVAVVCLGYPRESVSHPLDGFGFLAPAVERRYVLGCLFPSSLFPDRAPAEHVALSGFIGGACHPERVAEDDDRILERAIEDLTPLLGLKGQPVVHRVKTWRPAIPQYVVGHGTNKARAEAIERDVPGLFISGNILHGISVADCIRNATTTAVRVADFLR